MGIGDSRLSLINLHDRELREKEVVRVVPNAQLNSGKTTTSNRPLGDRAPPSVNALRSVVVVNSRSALRDDKNRHP